MEIHGKVWNVSGKTNNNRMQRDMQSITGIWYIIVYVCIYSIYIDYTYIYASPPKPTFLWLSCWFSCWCLCVRGRDMQIGRGIADKRKYCILIVCQRQRHANNFVHIYRLVVSKGIADKNVSDCLWWWNFVFSWHLHDNASCSKQWSIDRRIFFLRWMEHWD